MSMKKQLLDPIGTMCKLVALNFNETKTKISIQGHVLTLQQPSEIQFLIRWYNKDGRENISEMYYAITRLIEWFLMPQKQDSDGEISGVIMDGMTTDLFVPKEENHVALSNSVYLRKMVVYLCQAFRKLQETYESGNVILALQFYINLLEDGLEGRYDEKKLPRFIVNQDHKYENLLDYDKIKNLWDTKRVKKVCELYENCFNLDVEEDESSSNGSSNSDTYIKEEVNKGKSLIKLACIEGNLLAIDAILETTDNEFNKLILNSNRG